MMGARQKSEKRVMAGPQGKSHVMTIEPIPEPGHDMDERTTPGGGEGRIPFSLAGHGGQEAVPSLGRVLIISEDFMVCDFLGQMSRLFGYDSQSCQEWGARDLEHTWQSYDAIFLESHFLHRFKNLKVSREQQISDQPMVVMLVSEHEDCVPDKQEPGVIHMLRKPLDYRQMGKIMNEFFQLKRPKPGSRDPEDSSD